MVVNSLVFIWVEISLYVFCLGTVQVQHRPQYEGWRGASSPPGHRQGALQLHDSKSCMYMSLFQAYVCVNCIMIISPLGDFLHFICYVC